MGFAAALLACLVTTCLMGEAHAYYTCDTKNACAYKGCTDNTCASSSGDCIHGMWDYYCDDGSLKTESGSGMQCMTGDPPSWAPCSVTASKRCKWGGRPYLSECPDPSPCAPGQYSYSERGEAQNKNGEDWLGAGACKPCDAGTFASSPGASSCTSCAKGTFAYPGATSCAPCSPGTYSDGGAETCSLCAAGTFTPTSGATSCSPCTAKAGFFCPAGSTSSEGVQCPAGFSCAGGSSDKQAATGGTTTTPSPTSCEQMATDFGDNAQSYREAIAGAAGTVAGNVVVVSNELKGQSGGSAGFEVQYKILASNAAVVTELTSRLGADDHLKVNVDTELAAQSLNVSSNVTATSVSCSAGIFTTALALAANTHPANVAIKKATQVDGAIEVEYQIRASNKTGVTALLNTLGTGDTLKAAIDDELAALSLSDSTAVTKPTVPCNKQCDKMVADTEVKYMEQYGGEVLYVKIRHPDIGEL